MDGFVGRKKAYFVELDDDDRERVMSCIVDIANIEMSYDNSYQAVTSWDGGILKTANAYVPVATIQMRVVGNEDGTLFTIEDFSQDDYRNDTEEDF
jgi:hypothetical protein